MTRLHDAYTDWDDQPAQPAPAGMFVGVALAFVASVTLWAWAICSLIALVM
jgi:hypothetical protein